MGVLAIICFQMGDNFEKKQEIPGKIKTTGMSALIELFGHFLQKITTFQTKSHFKDLRKKISINV